MGEPMTPEEAWDKALNTAFEECLKSAPRKSADGTTYVGARTCYEVANAIIELRGKLHDSTAAKTLHL